MEKISVSTITPVYSGRDYLPHLARELADLRASWEREDAPLQLIEAIFVDDASTDGSADVLEQLAQQYPWLRVVTLSKNFGQHPATIAGILYSSGDWVATLDEDLQHHPQRIVEMLKAAVRNRADIIYAQPIRAVHGKGYRDSASRLVKRLVATTTGSPMMQYFNSFRLIRGSVARAAASVCGYETYLDVALSWFADRFKTVDMVLEDPRFIKTGRSGYNVHKLISHARRLIVSSQPKFLRIAAVLGSFTVIIAIVFAANTLYHTLSGSTGLIEVRGWASLFVSILFFGGLSAFLLSVILEYLTNVVLHTQGKPVFFPVDRQSDAILEAYFTKSD